MIVRIACSFYLILFVVGLSCLPPVLSSAAAETTALSATMHWYRGNTHTHTKFSDRSDANGLPAEVVSWYKSHGYQFVVITDHENLTDVDPLNKVYAEAGRFIVLRGQEITQVVADPSHVGGVRHAHVNGIDTHRLIMPILPKEDSALKGILRFAATGISIAQTYQRNLAEIEKAGGIAQINHPNLLWSVGLKDLLPIDRPFLFEIWNGYPASNNLGGSDGEGNTSPSAESLWDSLLSGGKIVWGVGSDDAHAYHEFDDRESPTPGRAWVVACAPELTPLAITKALKQGSFYASTGVKIQRYRIDAKGITIDIERLPDWSPNLVPVTRYTTRFLGNDGKVLSEVQGTSPRYAFRGDESYVRASIIDSDGRKAWTQPVFHDHRRTMPSADGNYQCSAGT
jgi:hypothetical protein